MTTKSFTCLIASAAILAAAVLPAVAANPIKAVAKAATPAAKTAAKTKEFGGNMPLPVAQRIERQNSPSDKLLVEVSQVSQENGSYVAYVKIVWGDLDNKIKGTGSQYYSNWDGSLSIAGASGAIDEKIQFDDGTKKAAAPAKVAAAAKPAAAPKNPAKAATVAAKTAADKGPHTGSGRDQVEDASGPSVDWKAGVVGVLDGLRIKVTSPTPTFSATLTAGKFVVPISFGTITTPTPVTPAAPATPTGSPGSILQFPS